MLKRPVWRRVEKVDYAASVVGITSDGLPGQGSLAMAFAQSLPFEASGTRTGNSSCIGPWPKSGSVQIPRTTEYAKRFDRLTSYLNRCEIHVEKRYRHWSLIRNWIRAHPISTRAVFCRAKARILSRKMRQAGISVTGGWIPRQAEHLAVVYVKPCFPVAGV
jgi:hypothetical protein